MAAAEAAEAATAAEAAAAAEAEALAIEAIRQDMKRRDAEKGMAELRQRAAVKATSAAAEVAAMEAADAAKLANSARAKAEELRLEARRQRGDAAGWSSSPDASDGSPHTPPLSPASSTLVAAAMMSASPVTYTGQGGSPRSAVSPSASPSRPWR